jgi:hypothetical protein
MADLNRNAVDYVEDPNTAARLHLELTHQLRRAQHGQPGLYTETKAALNKLHHTWPEAPARAAEASEDDLGGLNPELRKVRDEHRRQRGVSSHDAANARSRRRRDETSGSRPRAGRGTPPPARKGAGTRRARASSSTRAARAVGRQTYRTSGGPGAASLAMTVLGATVGFAVLYAVLSNADRAGRGRAVVEVASSSFTRLLNLLLLPVDPLNPRGPLAVSKSAAPGTLAGAIPILGATPAAVPTVSTHTTAPTPNAAGAQFGGARP